MGLLLQLTMSCQCALSIQFAGAGAVSWLCTWWRQGAGAGAGCWLCAWWRQGAGAGAVSWLRAAWRQGAGAGTGCWLCVVETGCRGTAPGAGCAWWRQGADIPLLALAARVVETGCRCWVPAVMGRMNLRTQHHTVFSLERSLSISAVGYLHSSGSVLADSCVKGCTACTHTFVGIMFYAMRNMRLSTDHCFSMFQHATHNSRAGFCLALGE